MEIIMLTSRQARSLAEESTSFIETNLRQIEQVIREESLDGNTRTSFVVKGQIELARRLASELVSNGFKATVRTELGLLYEHKIDISW